MLKYKGYSGQVEFDTEVGLFHGEVLDTRDVITFQGRSVDEVEAAFRESIDDYLEFSGQRDQKDHQRLGVIKPSGAEDPLRIRKPTPGHSLAHLDFGPPIETNLDIVDLLREERQKHR